MNWYELLRKEQPESPMFVKKEPEWVKTAKEKTNQNDSPAPKEKKKETKDDEFLEGFNFYSQKEETPKSKTTVSVPERRAYSQFAPKEQGIMFSKSAAEEYDDFVKAFNDPYGEEETRREKFANIRANADKRDWNEDGTLYPRFEASKKIEETPYPRYEASRKNKVLDGISTALTAASFIPGLDTFTNIAQIPVDLLRGDYISAGLDLIGAIPFVGEIADGAKTIRTADRIIDGGKALVKAADVADDSIDTGRALGKASENIKMLSTERLYPTHRKTYSKKQFEALVDDVAKNGIIEPIKVVEYKGNKYVVDGHHRLSAAKRVGLKEIPVEEVSLPFKGYRGINDLFWYE